MKLQSKIQRLPVPVLGSENRHSPLGGYKGPFVFFDIIFKSNSSFAQQVSFYLDLGKDTVLGMREIAPQVPPEPEIPVVSG